jgi:hypothetical protein
MHVLTKYIVTKLTGNNRQVLISSSSGLMSLVHHNTNMPGNKDMINYVKANIKAQQVSPNNVKHAQY